MRTWDVVAVVCSPLLGLLLAVLVVMNVDAGTLSPQRTGIAGVAGTLAVMFFYGAVVTVPLGLILLLVKRWQEPDEGGKR